MEKARRCTCFTAVVYWPASAWAIELLPCCEWFDFLSLCEVFAKKGKPVYTQVGSNQLTFGKGTKLSVTPIRSWVEKPNSAGHFCMGGCYCVNAGYNKATFGKGTLLLVSPVPPYYLSEKCFHGAGYPTFCSGRHRPVLLLFKQQVGPMRFRNDITCSVNVGGMTGKLTFGKGTQVSVISDIQDPAPAMYQLKDPKSSNNSVCLFTDFDSQAKVPPHLVESEMFISDKTVLDMKSMDSRSIGALAWSSKADFKCAHVFTENTSNTTSSEVSCDAKLIEKSFETDMNLNFQNLSVMGLRILLLKVAGFNLLMTLRLWSK